MPAVGRPWPSNDDDDDDDDDDSPVARHRGGEQLLQLDPKE